MTDRLLHLIEPDDLGRAERLVAWLAGGLIGAVLATAALVLFLGPLLASVGTAIPTTSRVIAIANTASAEGQHPGVLVGATRVGGHARLHVRIGHRPAG